MKGRKILAFLTGFSILTAGACSCGDETQSSGEDSFVRGEEIEFTPTVSERYVNQRDIEGQWGPNNWTGGKDYGIGDPFVMRWNGKYYMYPSTNDAFKGVKVFVSDDMINWTYAGLAVADTEATSHGSYAPEVVYYDGYFYMCQSRAGKGH
ncbi:MAG: family 43 glycosylhydrolase, partial [Clostridia bacterium]|nr:family 43 glycosylhydrolase [Clostridia bacterium]